MDRSFDVIEGFEWNLIEKKIERRGRIHFYYNIMIIVGEQQQLHWCFNNK